MPPSVFNPKTIPLSLYIHIPWCVKKCPYCDFNSHTQRTTVLPEREYIAQLEKQMQQYSTLVQERTIHSIFFGGGTPSLFSPQAIARILSAAKTHFNIDTHAEITLEANPGTVEQQKFHGFFQAGINRLSIGVQSFHPRHLQKLGRIHDNNEAIYAVESAKQAGFTRINIDLMYGLSTQTITECLNDMQHAIALETEHISWYQLTIEPNTAFHKWQPPIPEHNAIIEMETAGKALLSKHGFERYEISAWCKSPSAQCQHNLSIWQFGDYLGIGAGACGKITTCNQIIRTMHSKNPKQYMDGKGALNDHIVSNDDLPFEFMLNHLRLKQPIVFDTFKHRTGLSEEAIKLALLKAPQGSIIMQPNGFMLSEWGFQFYNDLVALFLDS